MVSCSVFSHSDVQRAVTGGFRHFITADPAAQAQFIKVNLQNIQFTKVQIFTDLKTLTLYTLFFPKPLTLLNIISNIPVFMRLYFAFTPV